MGRVAGDAGSGDHIHLQEGAEYVGIVVQDRLLQFNGKLPSLCRIEFRAHLFDQFGDVLVFIGAEIVAHAGKAAGGKEVLGVSGRRRDQGGGVNIPAVHLGQEFPPVGRAVDIQLDADILERGLGGLGQKRKLLTAGVGKPADGQLLSVLFTDAVAVGILPSGILQNLCCPFRIKFFCLYILSAEGTESVGESTVAGGTVSFQQCRDKAFLVDPHGNGPADRRILDDRACHVHGSKKGAGCLDGRKLEAVVFKIRIGLIGHTVGGVDVACKKGGRQCVAVGKRADGQGIDLGSAVPVIVIFGQGQVMIRLHVGHHIGTRARNDPFFKIGCLHIDDTAVGIAQVVHQRRIGLAGNDGQGLTVCLDLLDLGIFRSAVMICEQMLQTFLDRIAVHRTSAGKRHIVLQCDGPGQITVIFPGFCKPGLKLHVVCIMDQCLADPVSDAGPAVVGAMGIDCLLPVLGVKSRVADDHGLAACGRCLRAAGAFRLRYSPGFSGAGRRTLACSRGRSAAARQQAGCQAEDRQDGNALFK